jgi:apolipoprotein N-acyltransferase
VNPPRSPVFLPATSGVLLTLSLPPHPVALLAPVALAPLAVALARLPPNAEGTRQAAVAGIVAGGFHALLLLHWLPGAARPLLGLGVGSLAALSVWGLNAVLTGLVAALVHRGASRGRLPLPLGLGAGWVVLGWAPSSLPRAGFPWLGPEAALVGRPWLLGASDLVGGAGVAGALAFVGGALGVGWVRLRRSRAQGGGPDRPRVGAWWSWPAGAVVLVCLAAGYGAVTGQDRGSPADAPTPRILTVAALALDADPALLASPARRNLELPHALDRLRQELHPGDVGLIVWPESPTGTVGLEVEGRRAQEWARGLDAPVAFGLLEPVRTDGGQTGSPELRRNRVRLAPARGEPLMLLREKRRLLPLLEARPPALEGSSDEGRGPVAIEVRTAEGTELRAPSRADRDWTSPPAQSAGATVSLSVGVLICFESLFGGEARRLRRDGARLLLLPLNEGWMAGRGGGIVDGARRQHEAVAVLRAVEARVPVVRSAVGGRAGVWTAEGGALPHRTREVEGIGSVILADLPLHETPVPLAARGGAGALGLLSLLVLLVGASASVRSRGV